MYEREERKEMIDKKRLLEKIDFMPPLSSSVMQLMTTLCDSHHSAQDVERVIESDPLLVGRVLRLVNSAAFARRTPAETINDAVSYLGDMTILAVAMDMGGSSVHVAELDGYEAARGVLWEHSLRTAVAARLLARFAKEKVSPSIAYTAGIMHDIGKVVLSSYLKAEIAKKIQEQEMVGPVDFLKAERAIVGTDHCEVGVLVAERWQLPDSLKEAIANHHTPGLAPEKFRTYVYLVHLADMLAMMTGVGTGIDILRYPLDQSYGEYVSLGSRDVEKIAFDVDTEFVKLTQAMKILAEGGDSGRA
jgi:putative nucleotidyltransferase with HDIG domain